MNNFNYNNYIGEHMSEPFEVFIKSEHRKLPLVGIVKDRIYLQNDIPRVYGIKDCIPLIRSISDLTDKELLSVVSAGFKHHQITINKREKSFIDFNTLDDRAEEYLLPVYIDFNEGISIGCDSHVDGWSYDFQAMLNKLYSLHVSIDYDELIKNGLAVRKE